MRIRWGKERRTGRTNLRKMWYFFEIYFLSKQFINIKNKGILRDTGRLKSCELSIAIDPVQLFSVLSLDRIFAKIVTRAPEIDELGGLGQAVGARKRAGTTSGWAIFFPALQVPPAETRLTVYRRLQV